MITWGNMSGTKKQCGKTWLFDQIGEKVGITEDMRTCFPDDWKMILSMAYYMAMTAKGVDLSFAEWADSNVLAEELSSTNPKANILSEAEQQGEKTQSEKKRKRARQAELIALCEQALSHITQDAVDKFLRLQAQSVPEKSFWCCNAVPERRKAKKEVDWRAENVAVLIGKKTRIPAGYGVIDSPLPDAKAIDKLMSESTDSSEGHANLVIDRALFSTDLVDSLLEAKEEFVIGAPKNARFVNNMIIEHEGNATYPYAYDDGTNLYIFSRLMFWPPGADPDDALRADPIGTVYLHLYFDATRTRRDYEQRADKVAQMLMDLNTGVADMSEDAPWHTYCTQTTGAQGVQYVEKPGVAATESIRVGYFALLTAGVPDAIHAYKAYELRNMLSRLSPDFENALEDPNASTKLMTPEAGDARLFISYLAAVYLFAIQKAMDECNMSDEMTMDQLFKMLERIVCWEVPGEPRRFGKVNKRQNYLYGLLAMRPPGAQGHTAQEE